LLRQQSVQVRVGAGVQRIEEDEENLGVRHVYQWVPCQGSQTEECNRCPAGEVGEDQQSHTLGHRHVRSREGRHCILTAFDGAVHARVARTDYPEGQSVEGKERY